MKRKKLWTILSVLLVAVFLVTACQTAPEAEDTEAPAPTEEEMEAEPTEAEAEDDELQVAFIYIGQPGDLGWTYEHEQGRLMVEEELGDQVDTFTVPDVPEGPDAEKSIRDVVNQGADMVFTTSFGYMDPTLTVAQDNPEVVFEHCSGYKTADNMSTYFGRIYQPRYLSGLVAGSMTENNQIGYVAAFPIPEVIRGINAFTLGVREVNPEATVRVIWTNTWYDPVKEREAAQALLDEGVDMIAQHQDTTEPQKAAAEAGALSIGYDSDMRQFVGDTVLTSPVWNWGTYYTQTIQNVLNEEWETHQYYGGLQDNVVQLAEFSPRVPEDVQTMVEEERSRIIDTDWDVFCGPINNQDGEVQIPEGECIKDQETLFSMDWFVEGVEGSIPEE